MPSIHFISLGGTITMTSAPGGGIVPKLSAADLVATVPELSLRLDVRAESLLTKPGASLSLDDLLDLADVVRGYLESDVDGVVVVQGTDTIEETAFVLDVLVDSKKPVVVTGAMRGPQSAGADGPANLLSAGIVAGSQDCRDLGTLVVLGDEIHTARYVTKGHTALPSAFWSPDAGRIGLVLEQRTTILTRVARRATLPRPASDDGTAVALVTLSLGDDGRMLRALPALGFRGVVLAAMGAGHVPQQCVEAIGALAAQMPVVLASRVGAGATFRNTYGFPGSEIDLIGRGVIPVTGLSAVKARLLLTLMIRNGYSLARIRGGFDDYGW